MPILFGKLLADVQADLREPSEFDPAYIAEVGPDLLQHILCAAINNMGMMLNRDTGEVYNLAHVSREQPIADSDLEITTGCEAVHPDQRGGQHVAKHCTGVRITHKPTGVSVLCNSERSQHGNRSKAMEMLRERVSQEQEKDKSND